MLRILQVCSAGTFGGGERHVADLASWLAAHGHEVHLAGRPASPLRRRLDGDAIHWHDLPLRGAADLESVGRLVNIIRRRRIDILHAHLARDYPLCGLAAKLTGVDLYLTRHHFRPLSGGRLYGWTIDRLRSWIAVSESVARELAKTFPAHTDRIEVIPNWIDVKALASGDRDAARTRLGAQRPLVAAVLGQVTTIKRQDLFIRAGAILLDANPELDLDLFVIGAPGAKDGEYAASLQRLVKNAGLGDRLHFAGHREDLKSLYAGFDLVVAPSDNEGFSLVLVEAMAAGRAVIATNVGGMAEILGESMTGRLLPPDDAQALAAAMKELLEDPDERRRLGDAAAKAARERFDSDRVLPLIEALYYRNRERTRKARK